MLPKSLKHHSGDVKTRLNTINKNAIVAWQQESLQRLAFHCVRWYPKS